MAENKPLDMIKDVTAGSLKFPKAAASTAIGLTKGALHASGQVAKAVSSGASGVVKSLVDRVHATPSDRSPTETAPAETTGPGSPTSTPGAQPRGSANEAPSTGAPSTSTQRRTSATSEETSSPPEPVNVTEKLGLDPAPVQKVKPPRKKSPKKPATRIDAAADPSDVDATPADVAKAVGKDTLVGDQPTP
ncbi:hypothetical protein ASG90_16570 [Nocardioides sp. Soil797]|nr:hypothetical protein ASG90_16570 [Nocardioides sp. Soil797]